MSIEFKNVSKQFGPKVILNNVSFKIETGEIVFILGKSGVGKSVTLKHIVGLLTPDSGQVFIGDIDVTALTEAELAPVRAECGMVFQHPALLDSLTLEQNISFGLKTPQFQKRFGKEMTDAEMKTHVREKLKLVQLSDDVLDRYPADISYGMQKRASLARTLSPNPSTLLFDEPTTGLDPISTRSINQLIFDLSRTLKVTSLVVSHDMGCALEIADRILVLDQGGVVSFDTVEGTKNSKHPLIQDFLKESIS